MANGQLRDKRICYRIAILETFDIKSYLLCALPFCTIQSEQEALLCALELVEKWHLSR